jgi:GntR family transcriptional regulator
MIEAIRTRLAGAASSSQAPKYVLLRDVILDAISAGEWTPGMRLPSEADLAAELPYSLGTIQRAYGELVKDGLIVRSRRRGSFVAPLQGQMAEPWHCRFLADDGSILPVYPRLVGHAPAEPDPRFAAAFGARARIIRIDRVFSIAGELEMVSRFFAPAPIVRPLLKLPRGRLETANFKAILLREVGIPVTRIVQTIVAADPERWHALKAPGNPHLVLEAIAYTADGEVAYLQDLYVPPTPRRLLFDSQIRP